LTEPTNDPERHTLMVRRQSWLGVVGLLIGVGAALVAITGSQASTATARHPIPLPSGSKASPSLCKSYFGPPSTIAKEFGVPTLTRTRVTSYSDGKKHVSQVDSGPGWLDCNYLRPENGRNHTLASVPLSLELTTQNLTGVSGACCSVYARAGKVFAYAMSGNPGMHVSARLQPWLRAAAARAVPPR
jgi:hypothetical protein